MVSGNHYDGSKYTDDNRNTFTQSPPDYFSNSKNYSRFGNYYSHVDGFDLSKQIESNNSSSDMGTKYSNASIDTENFGIENTYDGNSTILNNISEDRVPISTVKTEFNDNISPTTRNCNGVPEVSDRKIFLN